MVAGMTDPGSLQGMPCVVEHSTNGQADKSSATELQPTLLTALPSFSQIEDKNGEEIRMMTQHRIYPDNGLIPQHTYEWNAEGVCPVSTEDDASSRLTKEVIQQLAVCPLVIPERFVKAHEGGPSGSDGVRVLKDALASRRGKSIERNMLSRRNRPSFDTIDEDGGQQSKSEPGSRQVSFKKHSKLSRTSTDIEIEIPQPLAEIKPLKTGKQRLRWNLVLNVIVWLIIPLPLWLPFASHLAAAIVIPVVQGLFVLMWVVISVCALRGLWWLRKNANRNFAEDYPSNCEIEHLFCMTCYKEPVMLIAATVQTVASQTEVGRISMNVAFEQKTPEVDAKIEQLELLFANSGFKRLIFTKHPPNQANEIPGKCSNLNHAVRQSVEALKSSEGKAFNAENIIVTTFDADTQFHPQYAEALTSTFLSLPASERHSVMYQAPLLYNWGLDGASFVTRITGILRSGLMMGALIPFNINTMSIFSSSMKLQIQGNFTHPGYQMEDIICLIRWMGVTKQRLRIVPIPVPVVSGPTSGAVIELEIMEWARQARRWTIGAAEVFHYFMAKSRGIPLRAALSWGMCFIIYYGILLCSGGLYGVSAAISMACIMNPPPWMHYTMYTLLGVQYLCFGVMFFLDALAPRLMKIEEYVSCVRNVFHWLLTPVVLIGYSLVELYALHEVVIMGKEVCKHGASKKDDLSTVTPAAALPPSQQEKTKRESENGSVFG